MNAIARTKSRPTFRVRRALQLIGAESARWLHEAHPIWRRRLVEARRSKDNDLACALSQAWAFLKRNMHRSCVDCGVTICTGIRCVLHANIEQRRK